MKIQVFKWFVGLCGFILIGSNAQAQLVEDLIVGSLTSHPSITAQESEVKSREAALETAKWQFYPTPGVELSTGQGSSNGSAVSGISDVTGIASLEQPIWTGGRLAAGIDRAEADLENSQKGLNSVQRQLSLDVVQAYGNWVSANLSAKAWETSMATHERLKASVGRRFEAGLTSKGDERLADSRLESVIADLASSQVNEQVALMAVSQLAGTGVEEKGLSVDLDLPSSPGSLEEILAKALALSPAIAQAISLSEVAKAELALQHASRLPQVFLRAAHQFGSDKNINIPTSHITVGVRSDFGAGLSSITAEKESQAAYEASLANVDVQRRVITETVRSNYYIVQSFSAQIRALSSTANTTEDVFNSYNRQYLAGRKTWFDLLNSARDLVQAQLRLADAKAAHFVASWRLALLTYGLDSLLAGSSTDVQSNLVTTKTVETDMQPSLVTTKTVETDMQPSLVTTTTVETDVQPSLVTAKIVGTDVQPSLVSEEIAEAEVVKPIVMKPAEVDVPVIDEVSIPITKVVKGIEPVELQAVEVSSSARRYKARIL